MGQGPPGPPPWSERPLPRGTLATEGGIGWRPCSPADGRWTVMARSVVVGVGGSSCSAGAADGTAREAALRRLPLRRPFFPVVQGRPCGPLAVSPRGAARVSRRRDHLPVSPTAGRGRTADRLSRSDADPGDWSLWFAAISRRRCPPRRGCRTAERHCGGRPVGAIRLSRCGPGCQLRAGRLRCVAKSVWGGGRGGQSRPVWADLRDHLHATATREKRPTGRGGDFRDRERIRSWAQAIARELVALSPQVRPTFARRGETPVVAPTA